MTGLIIREFRDSDTLRIIELAKELWEHQWLQQSQGELQLNPKFRDSYDGVSEILEMLSNSTKVFVATYNNRIVGYIVTTTMNRNWFKEGVLFIDQLSVSEKFRRLNIGTTLIDYVKQYASNNDYKYLRLRVIDSNTSAINCYSKYGFDNYCRDMVFDVGSKE